MKTTEYCPICDRATPHEDNLCQVCFNDRSQPITTHDLQEIDRAEEEKGMK